MNLIRLDNKRRPRRSTLAVWKYQQLATNQVTDCDTEKETSKSTKQSAKAASKVRADRGASSRENNE